MKDFIYQYGKSFLFSFLIHGILLALLIFSFHSQDSGQASLSASNAKLETGFPQKLDSSMKTASDNRNDPRANKELKASKEAKEDKETLVHASIVDEKAVMAEVKRQEMREKQQKEEFHRAELAKKERVAEQAKLLELKKELAKAKAAEEARLAELKAAKEKEQKQLQALKKEKEKEEKRLAQIDELRQEEQDRANQARQERAIEEKKQNELEARRKLADEKQETNGDGAEQGHKASAEKSEGLRSGDQKSGQRQGFLSSELARFQSLFRDKVNQSWIRAPGLPQGLSCMLEIHLLPDGSVTSVRVINSSGNYAFDQAAEAAVQKASPLPVPREAELMDKFRHFTFEFKPPENA